MPRTTTTKIYNSQVTNGKLCFIANTNVVTRKIIFKAIRYATKVLNLTGIPNSDLIFDIKYDSSKDDHKMGYYLRSSHIVHINLLYIDNYKELIEVLFHECRHAYQQERRFYSVLPEPRWFGSYYDDPSEIDAREWASRELQTFMDCLGYYYKDLYFLKSRTDKQGVWD